MDKRTTAELEQELAGIESSMLIEREEVEPDLDCLQDLRIAARTLKEMIFIRKIN